MDEGNMYRLTLVSVALVAAISCQTQSKPEARFWAWFQDNSDRLITLETASGPLADELAAQLRKVDSGLVFELGGKAGEPREFIVSADGMADTFPAVERLTRAAPELPGWTVIAFRPRIGTGFDITFGEFKLTSQGLWFSAEPDGDRIGLTLYIAGLDADNRDTAIGASFIMLDSALGEYDVLTKIGYIEHRSLPEHPESQGLRPLEELPAVVDQEGAYNEAAPSNNVLKLPVTPLAFASGAPAA